MSFCFLVLSTPNTSTCFLVILLWIKTLVKYWIKIVHVFLYYVCCILGIKIILDSSCGLTQVVECLPIKHKALSSNPSTTKNKIGFWSGVVAQACNPKLFGRRRLGGSQFKPAGAKCSVDLPISTNIWVWWYTHAIVAI
jgi:hypothetical protein